MGYAGRDDYPRSPTHGLGCLAACRRASRSPACRLCNVGPCGRSRSARGLAVSLPDANGKMIQIRSPDREHFTAAGDLMVAIYLMPKILAILGENGERICAGSEGHAP